MKSAVDTLEIRRKRKGLTNYRKRLKILSSKKPRLIIRKSLKSIQASLAVYDKKGDIIKVCAHSSSLKKLGWPYNPANLPSAYLVGFLLGSRAKEANISEAIPDIGLNKSIKGSKIYAVLAGAVDAGLKVPHEKEMLPVKERIAGSHIEGYAKSLASNQELLKKRFGNCIKKNANPENITKKFEEVKANILKDG